MAADLVTIATTAVLTQFLGPSAKHLGEQALERGKQVAAKATTLLAQVGREAQPVEPKLLLPLIQAASLETDPTMTEKWAALLANAADPAQQMQIHPSYIDVLRQMTSADAQVLSFIYSEAKRLNKSVSFANVILHFVANLGREVELSYDNLLRLRLFEMVNDNGTGKGMDQAGYCAPTRFGKLFLDAVTPPIP
jgi:hypothetical protein